MRIDNPTFGPTGTSAIESASFAATSSLLLGSVVSASIAISSSFATSASLARTSTSASFASTANTASYLNGNTPVYISTTKSDVTFIPNNAETIITGWNAGSFINNTTIEWSPVTGTFQCRRAGIYEIEFAMALDNHLAATTTNREFAVMISKNGTLQAIANWYPTNVSQACNTPTVIVKCVLPLALLDNITPRVYQNLITNASGINTIPGRNWFVVKELPNRIS
jgi:hypothetical protein